MRKPIIVLALVLFALPLALAGCGEKEQAAVEAGAAVKDEAAVEIDAVEQVVAHDCDGGCGMKDVPLDQLKEIDGKFYCAGCAQNVKPEEDHTRTQPQLIRRPGFRFLLPGPPSCWNPRAGHCVPDGRHLPC